MPIFHESFLAINGSSTGVVPIDIPKGKTLYEVNIGHNTVNSGRCQASIMVGDFRDQQDFYTTLKSGWTFSGTRNEPGALQWKGEIPIKGSRPRLYYTFVNRTGGRVEVTVSWWLE